jgi:hypothetical protein
LFITVFVVHIAGAGAGLQHVMGVVVTASTSCLERGSDEGNVPVVVLPVPIAASKPPPPANASSTVDGKFCIVFAKVGPESM